MAKLLHTQSIHQQLKRNIKGTSLDFKIQETKFYNLKVKTISIINTSKLLYQGQELIFNQKILQKVNSIFSINSAHSIIKQIQQDSTLGDFEVKLYMLETRVSHKPQNINYELMRNSDPKIIKWEQGVNSKVQARKINSQNNQNAKNCSDEEAS